MKLKCRRWNRAGSFRLCVIEAENTGNRRDPIYDSTLLHSVKDCACGMNTPVSLREKDQRLLHPLHHPQLASSAIIFERAEGIYLYSTEGQQLIDGMSGLWNVSLGHGRPELADAAHRQMMAGAYASNYAGTAAVPTIELAHRIAGFAYPDLNSTFFTSGGAESNESAFKTVRYYWKRMGKPHKTKIISRMRGYHGVTMAAMSAAGIPSYWHLFEPMVPGFLHINPPFAYRFPGEVREEETVGLAAARELEEMIQQEGPDTVGAFIAEPVIGAGGVIVPPDDYFPRIREICDAYEILLISDEVITGWGRTGEWFGLHHWGIQPDIMSFAKAITSGYVPLGGIQVHDRIREVMDSASLEDRWSHAFTYSGHPVACAVALANLEILVEGDFAAQAKTKGQRLMGALRHLEEHDNVGEVRGLGMMLAVELVADKETRQELDGAQAEAIRDECAKRGLLTRCVTNQIVLSPPLITPEDELDRIASIISESVEAVCSD